MSAKMFDEGKVKLGIAPIAWTNDDLPDLGKVQKVHLLQKWLFRLFIGLRDQEGRKPAVADFQSIAVKILQRW